MQNHPIPSVTDPLQYRAIGIVRGIYKPQDDENFTRGALIDAKGNEIDSVVLGRVITLIRNHVSLEKPHLWVVYPDAGIIKIFTCKSQVFGNPVL